MAGLRWLTLCTRSPTLGRMDITFCTRIGVGTAFSLLVASKESDIRDHGNKAVAFMTGTHATGGVFEDVREEEDDFRASGLDQCLKTDLFDFRWIDDDDTREHVDAPDDDGENLNIVSPWGVYEGAAKSGLVIFFQREPTADERDVLMTRAILYFRQHGIDDLYFRLIRQTTSVSAGELTPPCVPAVAPARKRPRVVAEG